MKFSASPQGQGQPFSLRAPDSWSDLQNARKINLKNQTSALRGATVLADFHMCLSLFLKLFSNQTSL